MERRIQPKTSGFESSSAIRTWREAPEENSSCMSLTLDTRLFFSTMNQDFCKEAMIWRQLSHENVLPMYGVNAEEFTPRLAMVLPWMSHGNMMDYLKDHPNTNRIVLVTEFRHLNDDSKLLIPCLDERYRVRSAVFAWLEAQSYTWRFTWCMFPNLEWSPVPFLYR